MNCKDTQQQFDDYLDHQLEEKLQAEFHQHLAECSPCREALNIEKNFRTTLAQLPIEPMSLSFSARALRKASNSDRPILTPLFSGAVAAGFLLIFSFVLLFQNSPAESISVTLLEEKSITLAFNSAHPIQQARFEIQLPKGVEIKGYPGQQMLAWDGSLKNGQNLLQLPIIVRSGHGGEIMAVISHKNKNKSLSINIEVAENNISLQPINSLATATI